jgi:hypothetical protein
MLNVNLEVLNAVHPVSTEAVNDAKHFFIFTIFKDFRLERPHARQMIIWSEEKEFLITF